MIFVGSIKEKKGKKPEFAWETRAPEILLFFSHMLPRSLVIPFLLLLLKVGVRATAKRVRRRGRHTNILYFMIFYECVCEGDRDKGASRFCFFVRSLDRLRTV